MHAHVKNKRGPHEGMELGGWGVGGRVLVAEGATGTKASKAQHGKWREPGRMAAGENDVEKGGESGQSQETPWARLEGWPGDTSEELSAEKVWSHLHVGETNLHRLPHMRIEPKARAPHHFAETALAGGPQFANPVVNFKVMSFLSFLPHLTVAHTIPPESLHPWLL